jgi:hypothetical protein
LRIRRTLDREFISTRFVASLLLHPLGRNVPPVLSQLGTRFVAMVVSNYMIHKGILALESMNLGNLNFPLWITSDGGTLGIAKAAQYAERAAHPVRRFQRATGRTTPPPPLACPPADDRSAPDHAANWHGPRPGYARPGCMGHTMGHVLGHPEAGGRVGRYDKAARVRLAGWW